MRADHLRTCAEPGCRAVVMRSSGHEKCSRHRPRDPWRPKTDNKASRARAQKRRRLRQQAAGVAWL